jgi:hypothetical protein
MQLNPTWRSSTTTPLSLAGGVLAGTILIVSGLTLAYASFATPLVASIAGGDRFGATPGVGGLATWALVIVGMAAFLGVGGARLAEILATVRPTRRSTAHSLAAGLGDDVVLVQNGNVGDGRAVPLLLLGRFGAAVVRELPDPALTRRQGPYWEANTEDGWIRIENPLERAARDGERVRRWLAHDDRDFVVRVYAAVVATDGTIPRTPTCAVIGPSQLPAWLASLPVQRSLTDARRAQLARMVGAAR